jgi:hypothetical protein
LRRRLPENCWRRHSWFRYAALRFLPFFEATENLKPKPPSTDWIVAKWGFPYLARVLRRFHLQKEGGAAGFWYLQLLQTHAFKVEFDRLAHRSHHAGFCLGGCDTARQSGQNAEKPVDVFSITIKYFLI